MTILKASQIPNTSSLPSLLVADSVESVALKENPNLADSQFLKLRNFLLNFSNIFQNNTVRSYLAFRNRLHSQKDFGKIFVLDHVNSEICSYCFCHHYVGINTHPSEVNSFQRPHDLNLLLT